MDDSPQRTLNSAESGETFDADFQETRNAFTEQVILAYGIPPAISALLLKPMESSNSTYEEAYRRWISGEYRKTYRYPDDFAISPAELGELSNTNRMGGESQEEAYRRLVFGEKKS